MKTTLYKNWNKIQLKNEIDNIFEISNFYQEVINTIKTHSDLRRALYLNNYIDINKGKIESPTNIPYYFFKTFIGKETVFLFKDLKELSGRLNQKTDNLNVLFLKLKIIYNNENYFKLCSKVEEFIEEINLIQEY